MNIFMTTRFDYMLLLEPELVRVIKKGLLISQYRFDVLLVSTADGQLLFTHCLWIVLCYKIANLISFFFVSVSEGGTRNYEHAMRANECIPLTDGYSILWKIFTKIPMASFQIQPATSLNCCFRVGFNLKRLHAKWIYLFGFGSILLSWARCEWHRMHAKRWLSWMVIPVIRKVNSMRIGVGIFTWIRVVLNLLLNAECAIQYSQCAKGRYCKGIEHHYQSRNVRLR